jgi:hypothetical protein
MTRTSQQLGFTDTRLVPAKKSSTAMFHSACHIDKSSRIGSKQDRMNLGLPWVKVGFWRDGFGTSLLELWVPISLANDQLTVPIHLQQNFADGAGYQLCGEQWTIFEGKVHDAPAVTTVKGDSE